MAAKKHRTDYEKHIKELAEFMDTNGCPLRPFPKIKLSNKKQDGLLIKTGFYDPDNKTITIFVNDRHIKDCLRSLAHEFIHHNQNLEGRLTNYHGDTLGQDEALDMLESEAYNRGNILFRKWTETKTKSEPKATTFGKHMKKKITLSEESDNGMNIMKSILSESIEDYLCEIQKRIDNFDRAEKYLDFKEPEDDFYFVQIAKRYKDNPHDNKREGNYRNGSWYLKSYKITSPQQLQQLKPEIISICDKNNARAYMCINSRSKKETEERVKFIKSIKPYADHVEDRVAGEAKDGENWKGKRSRLLIDIDTNDKRIWKEVHEILDMCNISIMDEYESSSGGLHIVIPNKEEPKFNYAKFLFRKFDRGRNMGRQATVHPNPDAKMILYANTETKGY